MPAVRGVMSCINERLIPNPDERFSKRHAAAWGHQSRSPSLPYYRLIRVLLDLKQHPPDLEHGTDITISGVTFDLRRDTSRQREALARYTDPPSSSLPASSWEVASITLSQPGLTGIVPLYVEHPIIRVVVEGVRYAGAHAAAAPKTATLHSYLPPPTISLVVPRRTLSKKSCPPICPPLKTISIPSNVPSSE